MNRALYFFGKSIGQFVRLCTMRVHQVRPELAERTGGTVLSLTHLGNLDPFLAGMLIRRPIRWMTRKEFFKHRPIAWLLPKLGAFSVHRQGIPVSSIRRAIELAKGGELVGICPEGGRVHGAEAAIHGGPIKKGVCSVAIRAGVPIVPCVMLGTDDLNRVGPWLPFKHIRLRVAYGEPIIPPAGKSTRAKRDALRDEICAAYVRLYGELRRQFNLDDVAAR